MREKTVSARMKRSSRHVEPFREGQGASQVWVRRAWQGQGTSAPLYLPVAPATTWCPRAFLAAGSERQREAGVPMAWDPVLSLLLLQPCHTGQVR